MNGNRTDAKMAAKFDAAAPQRQFFNVLAKWIAT
jgi:hypothetical protein